MFERLPELFHKVMPQVSVASFVVLYAVYHLIFTVAAKKNDADMDEIRPLIPITFGLIVMPAIYLVWRGWFKNS